MTLNGACPNGTRGPKQEITNVKAVAATVAPDAPTNLAVEDLANGTSRVTVTASASSNNRRTVIYRDSVEVYSGIGKTGASIAFDGACGVGTCDWTARAFNVSGLASAAGAGTVSQTIT